MAAGNTYTPIATQTLGSAAASVTFSSISGAYTDLVLIVGGNKSGTGSSDITWQANGNTGSNYSQTALYGAGSVAESDRGSNATAARAGRIGASQSISILNFFNYSNTTTNKICIARGNVGDGLAISQVSLFRNTSAITSLSFALATADNFASGCVFSLYGIASTAASAKATGGDLITSDGTYYYHTFTSSGTFTPSVALTCDYLVVAGGGGGGSRWAGGGGAGGLRSTVTATGGGGSLESALALASGTGYTVTIGAGGAGGAPTSNRGASGSNSVFSTITSTGGGGGGTSTFTPTTGGAGGGAGFYNQNGAAGTANQGFAGGNSSTTTVYAGGGGGGAGAVGANAVAAAQSQAGAGGAGVAISISGSSVTYAGGGGGGAEYGGTYFGAGGAGGGGNGSSTTNGTGSAGTANRGGGGGGGGNDAGTGGAGGSGIVIVRYPI